MKQGIMQQAKHVYNNVPTSELIEYAVKNENVTQTDRGAISAYTGKYTGRLPKDKFIVLDIESENKVAWGKINKPIKRESYKNLYSKAMHYIQERELFLYSGLAGSDYKYQLSFNLLSELSWHSLFAKQLFQENARPASTDNVDFTILCLPGLKADPIVDKTHSEAFVIISFEEKVVLIGGTSYAGEIKKAIFTILNFYLPSQGVLPMHCSANAGREEDVTLFFGLSGTGKTTLSTSSDRYLIGDDEHGWSEKGIFNFENGCYAKCLNLSKENEPEIWNAIQYGSVLENVVIDEETKTLDFQDNFYTDNTRIAYSLDKIDGSIEGQKGKIPSVIIFLTADAFGVLPPLSLLTNEQAVYHFSSGYTAKIAGTEQGIKEPKATFSACFGEPFLPLKTSVYTKLFREKLDKHDTKVYLVNTGWVGGPYGIGERISLEYTKKIVDMAINDRVSFSEGKKDLIFDLNIPDSIKGVPSNLLNPKEAWDNEDDYYLQAKSLLEQFQLNSVRI